MSIHLNIIDAISDPGKFDRANEDRAGYNSHAAFVLDGATGLGDQQFMDGYGSDAAWMAEFAMERLARDWQAGTDIRDLVRRISTDAREVFFATAGEQPRYAWPLAAFAALNANATETSVTFTGLGDSAVYLLHDDGRSEFLAARPDAFEREQTAARAHLERIGGMGGASSIVNDPTTLADLRKSREGQNTPGGRGWSFGLVPEVADHLTSQEIAMSGGATAIICSDGLVDLVALYQAYDAGSLIRRAATAGLKSLIAELRRFEREIDPNALQYPRFKQSDDTTALLLRVEIS